MSGMLLMFLVIMVHFGVARCFLIPVVVDGG